MGGWKTRWLLSLLRSAEISKKNFDHLKTLHPNASPIDFHRKHRAASVFFAPLLTASGQGIGSLNHFRGPPATPSYPPKVDKNVFFYPPLTNEKSLNCTCVMSELYLSAVVVNCLAKMWCSTFAGTKIAAARKLAADLLPPTDFLSSTEIQGCLQGA